MCAHATWIPLYDVLKQRYRLVNPARFPKSQPEIVEVLLVVRLQFYGAFELDQRGMGIAALQET